LICLAHCAVAALWGAAETMPELIWSRLASWIECGCCHQAVHTGDRAGVTATGPSSLNEAIILMETPATCRAHQSATVVMAGVERIGASRLATARFIEINASIANCGAPQRVGSILPKP
jgi:hypothetical protein